MPSKNQELSVLLYVEFGLIETLHDIGKLALNTIQFQPFRGTREERLGKEVGVLRSKAKEHSVHDDSTSAELLQAFVPLYF